MAGPHFVNIDRDTPLLLPVDLREWIEEDDLARFVLEAVAAVDVSTAVINTRGCGSAQYPPCMMLAVLLYCYATGIFSSRQIERLTHQHLSVRYLAGNEHPDHDTICKFRRENGALIKATLGEVVRLAGRLGLGRVGTICLDGTKLVADASTRRTFNDEELRAEEARLDLQIDELLAQAAAADAQPEPEAARLPAALRSRERLREQVRQAREALAAEVKERAQARAAERAEWKKDPIGECPRALAEQPQASDRINLTDPDGTWIARQGQPPVFGYNAQLAVSAEAHAIIVAAEVCTQPNDRQQLRPMMEKLPLAVRAPLERVVVDTGYDHCGQILAVETTLGLEVICPPQKSAAEKAIETATPPAPPAPPEPAAKAQPKKKPQSYRQAGQRVRARMKEQSESEEGRAWLKVRRTTVEPVFGLIKSVLGFRRFHLRGLAKVNLEWQLVATAFNCRRLSRLFTPEELRAA